MVLEASPSPADLTDLADELLIIADEIEEDLTLEELLDLFRRACTHPVTVFIRRMCDLVTVPVEDEDA